MKQILSSASLALLLALGACAHQAETPRSAEVSETIIEAVPAELGMVEPELETLSVTYDREAGAYQIDWTVSQPGLPVTLTVSPALDSEHVHTLATHLTETSFTWVPPHGLHGRHYFTVVPVSGLPLVAATRVLPLEQASNFRDIGGYQTEDGRTVKWGQVYRSGAMPLLTEADYTYLESLGLDSVVDFRSIDEREVVPDLLDDRTGALFIANDYSIAALMQDYQHGDGENMYAGMEEMLRPQYRSMIRRIVADEGAVLYHCSAGQDRTGVATALIYEVLGVDRETIIQDYHLSTELRRTQFEMPDIDPADYPGNMIVQYYMAARAQGRGAEPLYTPSGASHIVQFFDYIDAEFGGAEAYMKDSLGLSEADIDALRERLLD